MKMFAIVDYSMHQNWFFVRFKGLIKVTQFWVHLFICNMS